MKLQRFLPYLITFVLHCCAEDTNNYKILSAASAKNGPLSPGQKYMFLEKWRPRPGTLYAKVTDYAHYKLVVGEVSVNGANKDFVGSTFEMAATGGSIPNSPIDGQEVNAYTSKFMANMYFDRNTQQFKESKNGPPAYEFLGTTSTSLESFKTQGKRIFRVRFFAVRYG